MDTDQLLTEEYFKIQDQIEIYDQRALTIKAWSVTISMTGIGAAFYHQLPYLLWLSSFSSLLFWSIEVNWKVFQRAFYQRALEIELYFSKTSKTIQPLQISHSWIKEFRMLIKTPRTYTMIFYFHIMMPHVIVAVTGPLIFFSRYCPHPIPAVRP